MEKSYIVTGAGSGIGRSIATALASASMTNRVYLVGRNQSKLKETLDALPRAGQHTILSADVTKPESLRKAFAESKVLESNLCGVIANAGVGGANQYGNGDRWDEVIATNLTGTYNLINEALLGLRKSQEKQKHIVIVSSILSRLGVPGYSAYCASKAGLLGLMRSWAAEFAREGILVNAVLPGWVNTEMAREGLDGIAQATGKSFESTLKEQMSFVPLQKMSEPDELGALVKYLVSEEQRSMTGQCLDINNGAFMA